MGSALILLQGARLLGEGSPCTSFAAEGLLCDVFVLANLRGAGVWAVHGPRLYPCRRLRLKLGVDGQFVIKQTLHVYSAPSCQGRSMGASCAPQNLWCFAGADQKLSQPCSCNAAAWFMHKSSSTRLPNRRSSSPWQRPSATLAPTMWTAWCCTRPCQEPTRTPWRHGGQWRGWLQQGGHSGWA